MSFRLLRSSVAIQALKPTLRVAVRPAAVQLAWQKPVLTTAVRSYAKKSKDSKKKSNKEDSKHAVEEEAEEFVRQFNEKEFQGRYENSITSLKEHLANMRMGRANPCKSLECIYFYIS